jgi:DNA repair protein RadC
MNEEPKTLKDSAPAGKLRVHVYELRRVRTLTVPEYCQCNEQARAIASRELRGLDRERVLAIYLNSRNEVMGIETIHIGHEGQCEVSMSCLFRGAIVARANGVIIAHNHPSGDVAPSDEDKELLETIQTTAKLLKIALVDFLIVCDGTAYSDMESIQAGRPSART